MFLLVVVTMGTYGFTLDVPTEPFFADVFALLTLGVATVTGAWLARRGRLRRLTSAVLIVTVVSAMAKALGAVAGTTFVAARVQSLPSTAQLADDVAYRVIMGTEDIALLCFCMSVWALASPSSYILPQRWARIGVASSVLVMFLSATRNLLAVAAVVLAIVALTSLRSKAQRARITRAVVGAAAILMALLVLNPSNAHFAGYSTRVLDNFTVVPREGTSWDYRMAEAEAAWATFSEHPVLGVGLGGAYREPFAREDYASFGEHGGVHYIHNAYLWVLAKIGLVGAASIVLLVGPGIFSAMRLLGRNVRSPQPHYLPYAIFIFAILLRSVVTPAAVAGAGAAMFGVSCGILWQVGASGSLRPSRPVR